MSRPEHLPCINTPEGIRRINEEQEHYDRDPSAYERRERERAEYYRQEQEAQNEEQRRHESDRIQQEEG